MKNTYKTEKIRIGTVVYDDGVIGQPIYQGDKIISASQTRYAIEHITNFQKGTGYSKVFIDNDILLYQNLTTKEYAVASILKDFIDFDSGFLKVGNNIADIKTISEILGENYEVFRRTVSSLSKKGVLKKHSFNAGKEKYCIVMNPYIYCRGKDVYRWIAELFDDTEYSDKNKKETIVLNPCKSKVS